MGTRTAELCQKIIGFPLTRIIIALIFVGGAVVAARFGVDHFNHRLLPSGGLAPAFILATAAVLFADLSYRVYVRLIEKRRTTELALRGAARELLHGIGLGAALFTATVSLLWAVGCYHVSGTNSWPPFVAALPVSIMSGYVEELVMRGIVFRITEDGLGSWLALAVSSALFGLAHLGNLNATWVSTVAITLEAGVLLAAAFMVTRRLWLAIGTHLAWNLTQGGIFGVAVSGHASKGLLEGELSGPAVLSGGSFGPEASALAVLVCLTAGVCLVTLAYRKGHIVKPFWMQ
jgi:membrane protease YdiL (CAAX protease family)